MKKIKYKAYGVAKIIDTRLNDTTVKWKNYPYKYNSVYDYSINGIL